VRQNDLNVHAQASAGLTAFEILHRDDLGGQARHYWC
jgi:hypothetical protein